MSRLASNRYTILSSDADDPPNDDQLPPSDESEHSSDDSGLDTPIMCPLPTLTSLLAPNTNTSPILVDLSPPPVRRARCGLAARCGYPCRAPHQRQHSLHAVDGEESPSPMKGGPVADKPAQELSAEDLEKERAHKKVEPEAEKRRLLQEQLFDKFLGQLKTNEISLAETLSSVYSATGRPPNTTALRVNSWANEHVSKAVSAEAYAITQSSILSKSKKVVNECFFLDFSLVELTRTLRGMALTMFQVLDMFASTPRQLKRVSERFLEKKELMKGAAALNLLRSASQNNNYAQAVNGMYLAATGGQQQHFPVLGIYGFSVGYTSIISSRAKTAKDATEPVPLGNLNNVNDVSLSSPKPSNAASCKRKKKRTKKKDTSNKPSPVSPKALDDALNNVDDVSPSTPTPASSANKNIKLKTRCRRSNLAGYVYNNINLMNRIAEAILGRKSAQENGTCATIFPLHKARLEHVKTADLDASILNAPLLTLEDIVLNTAESQFLTQNMVHTILRIIVGHGGLGFMKWQKDLNASQPASEDVIDVHKTTLHPLPAREIDENSITGNVEVVEEIMRVLGFRRNDPNYGKYVQILGHEIGLFHGKIADCHGLLETHFEKPSAGTRSPGSLRFHNTVLDRLPITLTSLPPFRTCRDLIMVSLYARVSSTACFWSLVPNPLKNMPPPHAQMIYKTYTDVDRVQELREQRIPREREQDAAAKTAKKGQPMPSDPAKSNLPHIKKGDMVFENTILFLHDTLLTSEFADAIKIGDSGAHRDNSAPVGILISGQRPLQSSDPFQNWLANPQGKCNGFIEIDLVQKHLNFWIKKVYKADGAGHSWDWLAMVSPCINILRQLATRINGELGACQGSRHTTPDLEDDIDTLMASLDEHDVYVEKEGWVLDDDEAPAPDGDVSTAPHPRSGSSARVDELRQCGASGKRSAILA
ncbi:hypothetical protein DFH08DRAFT_815726 [Mycena albidolilacea]|uniref:DUF6589 domain-containing protein n=1 Tax=Mycena albidolilacea TaxID=1033008 RepID=A0AAD7EJP5_9AGAR|nr:hypothetical protein DFH08DRAFT_815726 [Mycena albidolilacea]